MQLPEVYNYRIIRTYNVLNVLDVFDTFNIINIKNYPIIMTLEKEEPCIIINNIPNYENNISNYETNIPNYEKILVNILDYDICVNDKKKLTSIEV
jgi:hypothetical protein